MSESAGHEALNRFGRLLSEDLDLRSVFPAAARALAPELGFDECALLVLDEPRRMLVLFASSIPVLDRIEIPLADLTSISPQAIARGEPMVVDDTGEARFAYDLRIRELGFRSHLAYPLRRSGRVLGTLNLASRSPAAFRALHRETLDAAGATLAIALHNALLYERVRLSEHRYASLVESARELIYRLDNDARFTFVNQAAVALLGRDSHRLQGEPWLDLVHADDRRPDLLDPLLRAERDEIVLEVKLIDAEGAPRLTSHRLRALREPSGERVGFQGIAQDLEGEREANRAIRRHHELVEALDDYVFMADTSGRILAINRKARETLGWNLDEVEGMTIWDLHPAEDKAKIERERWRIVETGASVFEVRLLARSGQTIPTRGRVTYSPESGTFQGVYRDISEEQLMQDRLLQVERLRALGEMASGVAHTFNNLLAVIGTTTQVARRLVKDEAVLHELEAIQQSVNDGGAAVRRIQDFTRKRPAELHHDVDLGELLRETARVAAHRARARAGPAVEIVCDIGELPVVRGSDSELKDAFLNLLFNSLDAMPEGGRIQLAAQHSLGRIVVEVADTGRGMTPDVRARIFTPFFSTKGERGSGLGLPIALNVVSQHGGSIEVASEVGRGTTMRVRLPAARPSGAETRRPARVLLVIDDPLLRGQVERAVARAGHLVIAAAGEDEARAHLERQEFEVVFADQGLAGGQGLAVARRARAGGARVVLLTGWGDEVSEETLRSYRLDGLLRKPFPAEAVLNLIHGLVEAGRRAESKAD